MLQRLFKLSEHRTTVGREVVAGMATFAAMAYILAVNPTILMNGFAADPAVGGDPASAAFLATKGALVTVTALTSAVATLLMALMTNFPLALAPGMGINAFFAFSICLGAGIRWQEALGSGKPRSLSLTGYVIAVVFLMEFFHIFPFSG